MHAMTHFGNGKKTTRMGLFALSLFCFAASTLSVNAHEYWIAPKDYKVGVGEALVLNLKNGQMFSGGSYPYVSALFERFDRHHRGIVSPVTSDEGARPAVEADAWGEGLHSLIFVSKPKSLTYRSFEKFQNFLDYEGLSAIAETHRARGLPEEGFKESYIRYAKTLVQVGKPSSDDKGYYFGSEFEWVAQHNPYAQNASDRALTFTLLRNGTPLQDWPVNIFFKSAPSSDDGVRSQLKTDQYGQVSFNSDHPSGVYMLNSVVIHPADGPENNDAVWESLWASMTFALTH